MEVKKILSGLLCGHVLLWASYDNYSRSNFYFVGIFLKIYIYIKLAFDSGFAHVYVNYRNKEYVMSFLKNQRNSLPNLIEHCRGLSVYV